MRSGGEESDGQAREPWQTFLPLANPPSYVHFSQNELALLLELKANTEFNAVMSLDDNYNGIIDIIRKAGAERESLQGSLRVDEVHLQSITSVLSKDEYRTTRTRMLALNAMIREAQNISAENASEAKSALALVSALLSNRLGQKLEIVEKLTTR